MGDILHLLKVLLITSEERRDSLDSVPKCNFIKGAVCDPGTEAGLLQEVTTTEIAVKPGGRNRLP